MAYATQPLIIQCPHCELYVEIEQINCGIFRHGAYAMINNVIVQLPPHAAPAECSKAFYGCGKPFRLALENGNLIAIKTDYI